MWLGFGLPHLLVVFPDASCAPRDIACVRGDRHPLSVAGGELSIDSRELVANVSDETVQLTELVAL